MMTVLKRKADHASSASKRPKTTSSASTAGWRKAHANAKPPTRKTEHEKPAPKSVFQDEERSFPRGGASVLTPLEYKQIQVKAHQDVLFEQAGVKRTGEGGLSDMAAEKGVSATPKRSKKKSLKKSKALYPDDEDERLIRVEGLSYKHMVPGTIVLGQVTAITQQDIVLALPNNLIGYVPLVAVSEQLNARLEKSLKDESDQKHDQKVKNDDKDIVLKDIFFVGQYLRACYHPMNENMSGSRKRLELSIDPKLVNKGLSRRKIPVNSMVQCAVVSNEDHGLVMDLGLNDVELKGFLPKGELDSRMRRGEVQEGTVFMCLVTGLNSDGRIVKLSADQSKAGNIAKGNTMTDAPTIDVFLPGSAVDVLVMDLTPTTVIGKLLGLVDATADSYHCGITQLSATTTQRYKIGSKVKGRVLFTCPGSEPVKVGISLLDHIVGLSTRMSGKPKDRKPPTALLPISTILENVKVISIQKGHGIFFDLGIRDVPGFAHISRLADDAVEILSEESGTFKIGSVHRARITGYNELDGLFQLSLQQKVLDQQFICIEDIRIGQVVKGKIHKLIIDKTGATAALVHLGDGFTGLVPNIHLADVRLTHPERKFQEGTLVTARVMYTDPTRHQIQLTLKKSLVKSEVEPWTDYTMVSEGAWGPGLLASVQQKGALVRFYGNVKAWLPVAEMSEAFIGDARRHFVEGQVVQVRVLSLNKQKSRMTVSCKEAASVDTEMEDPLEVPDHVSDVSEAVTEEPDEATASLRAPGFDWTGASLDLGNRNVSPSVSSDEDSRKKRKKSRKPAVEEDQTGDLDARGPQCAADYERLLLGQPNSAEIWVRYMVFQRELNEIENARQIGRRALATINAREEQEKLDVWTALLHLENEFAAHDETMEEVFKEACQHNDAREVNERMIKIYISSGKLDKANRLYQSMTKNKSFTQDPHFWLSYATFLMDVLSPPSPAQARNLLQRAAQSVPSSQHRYLTQKFAALEFKSANGDAERGRTIFESLVSTWPNKGDIWDVYVSLEMSQGNEEGVRNLFERIIKLGKSKRKANVFKKWTEWEESIGNAKGASRVKMLEERWREDRKRKEDDE